MKKTALITGGTSGIGEEFANQLADRGYNIIIIGRNSKKGAELVKHIENKFGVKSEFLKADLATKDGIKAVEDKISKTKDLEFLVNNAGFGLKDGFLETDVQKWEDMINVHNLAIVRLSHQTLKIMKKDKKGNIINVASLAAYLPTGDPLYNCTKAFIKSFSLNLFFAFREQGLYIQALCPGFVKTNLFKTAELRDPIENVMEAKDVVKMSLKCCDQKKAICMPGTMNRVLRFLMVSLPNKRVHVLASKKLEGQL